MRLNVKICGWDGTSRMSVRSLLFSFFFLSLSMVSSILRGYFMEVGNNNVILATVSSTQVKKCTFVRIRIKSSEETVPEVPMCYGRG